MGDEEDSFFLRGTGSGQYVPMSDIEPFCRSVEKPRYTEENIIGLTFKTSEGYFKGIITKIQDGRCHYDSVPKETKHSVSLVCALNSLNRSNPWWIVTEEKAEKPNKEAFENCKIWIGDSVELSRKVQEKLFELGFVWPANTKPEYYHVNTSNGVCFLTSDKHITWGSIDSFQKETHKQVSLEDLGIHDQIPCVAPETSVVPISKPVKKTVQTDVRVSSYTTVVLELPKTQPKKIKQVVLLNNKTITI
jgi:hypothetical protein